MSASKTGGRTAADVMHRDLVVVNEGDTLQEAMQLMTENHVTGLPVVDGKSRCIGVVSTTDIVNYEQENSELTADAKRTRFFDPDTQQWESVSLSTFAVEEFADVPVRDVMSRDLVSVERTTPIEEVARMLLRNQVHRVVVIDEKQRLYGVISAFDFVRIVAEAD